MPEEALIVYTEEKKRYYCQPEVLAGIRKRTDELLQVTEFTVTWQIAARWLLELLCFTLDTLQGREMYLQTLNHAAPQCPDIAEKYWNIFDDRENLINRYRRH